MLPLDMSPSLLIPHEIASRLVQAVGARQTVVFHGVTNEVRNGIGKSVAQFAGDGRA